MTSSFQKYIWKDISIFQITKQCKILFPSSKFIRKISSIHFTFVLWILIACMLIFCNWDYLSGVHIGRSERSAPRTIWKICTRDDPSDLDPERSAPRMIGAICTRGNPNDLHLGQSERSAPGAIQTICTRADPNDLHPGQYNWFERSEIVSARNIWRLCLEILEVKYRKLSITCVVSEIT